MATKTKEKRDGPLSLAPLSFIDAVKGLGSVKLPKKAAKKKPARKKR